MKKLIIASLLVVAAAISHAATATWTATNIKYSNDPSLNSNGYIAYMFTESASVVMQDVLASINGGTFNTNYVANNLYTGTGVTSSGRVTQSGVGDYTASTTYTAFAVIFDAASYSDAKNYMIVPEKTVTVNAAGSNITFGFSSQAANTWQAMAVPEPTSGLLLLLGMAGLALRRKQA